MKTYLKVIGAGVATSVVFFVIGYLGTINLILTPKANFGSEPKGCSIPAINEGNIKNIMENGEKWIYITPKISNKITIKPDLNDNNSIVINVDGAESKSIKLCNPTKVQTKGIALSVNQAKSEYFTHKRGGNNQSVTLGNYKGKEVTFILPDLDNIVYIKFDSFASNK
jgi:hypothetical protein